MRIELNGEVIQVESDTLDAVLSECGYQNPTIATALNGTFIHKHQRVETAVVEGDKIEVVAPIEGG